jgi:multiple sugar transport system substrate-binding protein
MNALTRRQFLKGAGGVGATLLLAACAPMAPAGSTTSAEGQAPSQEKITLRWDVSDATDVPAMMEMGNQATAIFNEMHPNIEVIAEPPPEEQAQQILTQMIAGNAPDIIGMCCAVLPFWAQKGQLLALDSYVERDLTEEQISDYPAAHWNAFANIHSGRFAMPMYMGSIVLYYNKDAFDAKGVAYPDDTWTWTLDGSGTYEEALRQLSDAANKMWGGRISDGIDRMQQKIAGNGGHWVNPEDDLVAAFDQPAALDALQWFYDRMWVDDIIIRDIAREGQNWEALMGNGRIAMYENGDWQLSPMVKTATYNWDVAPLPQGPVQRNSLATTDGWSIWKGTKGPEESWEFVKFLQTDEWNELMITVGLLRPSRLSLFDRWISLVSESTPELADKNLQAFGDAVEYATPLELFQFNAEAEEIIIAARDETIRTGSNPDVKGVFTAAAQAVNESQQKAKAAAG